MMSLRRPLAVAIVMGTVAGMAGCATSSGSDFVVVLPNGYLIQRDKASDPVIYKRSGGAVIDGPVAEYTVHRDVVMGVIGTPPPPGTVAPAAKPVSDTAKPAARRSKGKEGYFVLDTRSGQVDAGLTQAAWNDRLKQLEVPGTPRLSPPVLPE